MKKLIALILVAGVVVVSAVGCGGTATTKPGGGSTGSGSTGK